ncbi:MAG: potassium transporter TrkG [bacterium]|nr:potassium transporter TrkG [bacterium]
MERRAFLLLVLGYFSAIFLGSLLLLLPFSRRGPLCFTDAFFTATSAICVTGLIVKDTPVFFTLFGKAVILTLIQLGGIGYMSVAGVLLHRLRRSLILPEMMAQGFPELKPGFAFYFAKRVVIYTLVIESIGIILLFFAFLKYFPPILAFQHAVFQAISAFCNAGFSTFSNSLMSFRGDPFVNFVVILLIITGGLGFFVLNELKEFFKSRVELLKKFVRKDSGERISGKTFRFSTHTRAVFTWTIILVVGGFILILFLEINNGFRNFSTSEKILAALFQSVTPRTCGFNTVDFSLLAPATLSLIMLLMYIGGSPGGTAGGVKTNTFALAFLWIFHHLRGYKNVYLFKRRISDAAVEKAILILILSSTYLFISYFLIVSFDKYVLSLHTPIEIAFETVSAFGTVGLSTGSRVFNNVSLSADFNILSKWIIILLMIIGKVGVLSVATYMIERTKIEIGYPEDRYIVG